LPHDNTIHFVPLFEEKKLQQLLQPSIEARSVFAQYAALQRLYHTTANLPSSTSSISLYQLIWKPLEPHLIGAGTIYFAPAGLLHRVAFGALGPDTSRLLTKGVQLHQVLSTRSLVMPSTKKSKTSSAALWGDINYNTQNAIVKSKGIVYPLQQETDTIAASLKLYTLPSREPRGATWNALPGTYKEIKTIKALLDRSGIHTTEYSGMTKERVLSTW